MFSYNKKEKNRAEAPFYFLSEKNIIVPNSDSNAVNTLRFPTKLWKHSLKELCPINTPIVANKALITIAETTANAEGTAINNSNFPKCLIKSIQPKRKKRVLQLSSYFL